MTDGAQLETTGAAKALAALGAAGEALTTGWTAARAQVSALEGQLGRDALGQAFFAGYRPVSAEAAAAVEQCAPAPAALAAAGKAGAAGYGQADDRSRAALEGIGDGAA